MKKTQSELIREKNAKAIKKMQADAVAYALLQERVRNGELTAGEALQSMVKKKGPNR